MTDEPLLNRSEPVISIVGNSSAGEGRSVLVKKPTKVRVISITNITPLPSSSDSKIREPVINVLRKGDKQNFLSEFPIHFCAFFMTFM